MEKKTIIAIVVCIGILLIWGEFFVETPELVQNTNTKPQTTESSQEETAEKKERIAHNQKKEKKEDNKHRQEEKSIKVKNDKLEVVWSSRGASIKSFILSSYKERVEGKSLQESEPKELVSGSGENAQLFQISFNEKNTDFVLPEETDWSVLDEEEGKISFRYIDESDKQLPVITKTIRFNSEPFVMDLEVELANRGDTSIKEQIMLGVSAGYQQTNTQQGCMSGCAPASATSPRAPACRVNGNLQQLEPKPGMKQEWEPMVLWTGINEQYFLISMVAVEVEKAVCKMETGQDGLMKAELMYPEAIIPPGGTVSHKFRVFVGPKQLNLLEKVQGGAAQPKGDAKLSEAVDFGWLSFLCHPLLWLLKAFHGVVKNWGIAIIFLTIVMKVLLLPLTQKMMKSQKEMGKLKPMMDDLKKKHSEDKKKLNEEMMKLFKANKINPMGGCFPMLLQMPIWFALYRVLFSTVELYQVPFIPGWIEDLSYRDPYFIMPIVLGVSMFLQQRLSPTSMDTQQAKMMMYMMPVFFTFIMLYLPSGLVLYIFTNNILTIGHQVFYNRLKKTRSPIESTS